MKATGKTCGGNDGCGKPKRQGFPQPWKSRRDSPIPTARLLLYIFPKPIPKGVFLTACTFSLQAHSSIRKNSGARHLIAGKLRHSTYCVERRRHRDHPRSTHVISQFTDYILPIEVYNERETVLLAPKTMYPVKEAV